MVTKQITVHSPVTGKDEPAALIVCDACGDDLFRIFTLAGGHQHLQCVGCDKSFCDGKCADERRTTNPS